MKAWEDEAFSIKSLKGYLVKIRRFKVDFRVGYLSTASRDVTI